MFGSNLSYTVTPISGALGAEVAGVDLGADMSLSLIHISEPTRPY